MSGNFIKAKQQLGQINSLIRQNKLLAAATSIYEAVSFVTRTSLMKHEQSDFAQAIDQAVYHFSNSAELKKIYPLQITYKEGNEKQLLTQLKEVLQMLQDELNDSLGDINIEDFKKLKLKDAQELLNEQKFDEAKALLDKLAADIDDDVKLKEEIAQKFFDAGRYKETIEYIEKASNQNPDSAHLFNKFGMELRKQGKFAEAEAFYLAAVKIKPDDEVLHFNLGRVYLDWERWDMVEKSAKDALNINLKFEEARKLLTFALKKQGIK